jgi:pimeloyl-ACP methyl ester carboxylesterase
MTAKTIGPAGRSISYLEAGEGPSVVFLHGIGSSGASFETVIGMLADRYRVIAWNAPGYGGSDLLKGANPSATDYANAVAVLLDALETGPVHLLGHSVGAIVATRFAALFPDRTRTLVLAGAAPGFGTAPAEARAKQLQERIAHMDELGPAKLAEVRSRVLLGPNAGEAAVEQVKAEMRRLDRDGYKQVAHMLANADLYADAACVAAPTLVVCGSVDQVTPEPVNRKIAGAIRGASYRSLSGLGHLCYVEDPKLFAGVLAEFLAAPAHTHGGRR